MRFKLKVTAALLCVGLVPMIAVAAFNLNQMESDARHAAEVQLQSTANLKKMAVENYFKSMSSVVEAIDHTPEASKALLAFVEATRAIEQSPPTEVDQIALNQRYSYQLENTADATAEDLERWTRDLDETGKMLQQLTIFSNENEIGQKQEMLSPKKGGRYTMTHRSFHPYFKTFFDTFGFYDLFLIEPDDGRIVYTVAKELDLGQSVKTGAYKDSAFFKAAAHMIENKGADGLTFVDFEAYEPSYNDSAAFMLAPLMQNGNFVGVLAAQLSFESVRAMLVSGMDESASSDAYLVGPGGKLRSVPLLDKERSIGDYIENPVIQKAVAGEHGVELTTNYRGEPVFTAYSPISLNGTTWALIAEIGKGEALAKAEIAKAASTKITAIIAGVILVMGLLVATWLLAPIRKLGREVQDQAAEVIEALRSAATNAREAAEQMATTAEETSRQSAAAKDGSNQTSGNVTTVAAAIEELSASVQEVVSGIRETATLINDASSRAESSKVLLAQLETATGRITGMVTLINDIANQTNLLALNAAVEAAHAGEAGKGFAVVASEIRKFAERTTESTHKIADEVRTVLDAVASNSSAMQSISSSITQVSDQARIISASAEQQGQVTSEIAMRMSDTASRVTDVDTNITQVEQASSNSAKSANDVLEEMHLVDTAAVDMDTAMTRFLERLKNL